MFEYEIRGADTYPVSVALQQALETKASPEEVKKILKEDTDNIVLSSRNEYGNSPLHSAIFYGASSGVIKVLHEKHPEAVEVQNSYGNLPLHLALYKAASADVIEVIFNAYPGAAEVQNNKGDFPLHCSLHGNASFEIVRLLLDSYPKIVEEPNNANWLPLHFACRYVESPNIVKMIFAAYRGAAQIRNKNGDLPLHYACVNEKVTYPVQKMLFDEFPESINKRNNDGKIPLEYAEASGVATQQMRKLLTPKSMPRLTNTFQRQLNLQEKPKLLLTSDTTSEQKHPFNYKPRTVEQDEMKPTVVPPNSINNISNELLVLSSKVCKEKNERVFEDIQKFLDRHKLKQNFLKEAAEFTDELNRTPVHYLAGADPPTYLVEKLLQLAPETATVKDNEGNLPLHCACFKGAPSPDIVNMLIDCYPDGIQTKNYKGELPINLVDCLDSQNMLCTASLPKSSKNDEKDMISVFNKTERTVLAKFNQSLPATYVQGHGVNLGVCTFYAGMNKSKAAHPGKHDKPSIRFIGPNKTEHFLVQSGYDGILFDFLCYGDERKSFDKPRFWAIQHFIKKGHNQELIGQPSHPE